MPKRILAKQLSNDGRKVFNVLNDQSDLAAVVVGASYLDAAIEALLAGKLLSGSVADKLLAPEGPLGSASSRVDLAYCLGLVAKQHYQDLRNIGKIRNLFAHSHLELDFSSSQVQEMCSQLRTWRIVSSEDAEPSNPDEARALARNKFMICTAILSQLLVVDALSTEAEQKT